MRFEATSTSSYFSRARQSRRGPEASKSLVILLGTYYFLGMATSLRLVPIDPVEANRLRARATVFDVADSFPGYPCRQCLQDAAVGDVLALVSYDPFTLDSPYHSASPIYLHKEDCGLPDTSAIPGQQLRRQLSVRAFDEHEMMLAGEVVNGIELEETAARLLAQDDVAFLHVHNASRGSPFSCSSVTPP
ncbi:MAG: DUF1203 domain-containing protein [Acidimicrobiales bacterium]